MAVYIKDGNKDFAYTSKNIQSILSCEWIYNKQSMNTFQ